ncbi:LysR substrate-binding domain-containing protein [Psychrobacter sp. SIMBA_152]
MATINFRLIKQLWMFLAVAEELHFGRAANRLGMSQPPLTEQIKILEHSLKMTLFERSRRGTRLTPAGEAILPSVKTFVNQVEKLEEVVREIAKGQLGVLHIGAITSAMLETVPALMEKLEKGYPDLTVYLKEIDTVEAVPALEAGEIDVAFVRTDVLVSERLTSKVLATDRLAVAIKRDDPLANCEHLSLIQLVNKSFIFSARQVSPAYFDYLISICQKNNVSPRLIHEVRSVTSQIAYVSSGQGVALVPYGMQSIAPKNVVLIPLSENIEVVTSTMVWNSERHHPMIDCIHGLLQEV